jgi:hypothetical protein
LLYNLPLLLLSKIFKLEDAMTQKLFFALFLMITVQTCWTMKNVLQLYPNNEKPTKIMLPFSYKELGENENCEKVPFISTSTYTLLTNGRKSLVGPLAPCVLIAITDKEKVVVFHKHPSNCIKLLLSIIEDTLNTKNPKFLQGTIFSSKIPEDKYGCDYKNNNLTQREEIKNIKDAIVEKLGVKRKQIDASLFHNPYGKNLGEDYFASKFVLVSNNNGNIGLNSLSPILEKNYFGKDFFPKNKNTFWSKAAHLEKKISEIERKVELRLLESCSMRDLLACNRVGFVKI